ncbi:CAP domain-containing protein [Vibrio sp. S9_S30]|uniref:CAP domain-containing protein n=1 Tax=Vibrio sp. S9_S30 TaxID=2720226 RepID=UPI001680AF83|nr:CAP domain-containing protein [Vibrio sp. S9_S30]MBD1559438.1 CAP domain-containing protein [Vibrio sp. S9_S30]
MRRQNLSATVLIALTISGCGGENPSGEGSIDAKASHSDIPSIPSSSRISRSSSTIISQQPDSKALKSGVIFAIEGLVERDGVVENYLSIPIKANLPAFNGGDTQKVDITIPTPTIIIDNDSRLVQDWHCYEAVGLTAQRKDHQLLVDGTLSEYRYDMRTNRCTNENLGTYVFNHAVFDSSLALATAGSVVTRDKSGVETNVPTYHFIAMAYRHQSIERFGNAWELMQRNYIDAAAKEVGASIFALDASSGNIRLDLSQLNDDTIIDFATLDKDQILNGSIWGMPGQGVADEKWCRIVNIPDDLSQDSIKYQSVISTNCARSTERYCDSYGSLFSSGTFPPAPPVAWDDNTASNAQLNSDVQYQREAQGHFIMNSMGQNAYVLSSNTAIIPVFGHRNTRSDGKVNNAGQNSWAGHAGHCQNVMRSRHTKMGIGYKPSKSNSENMSYWTQDFN